jgi:hypothetical protein
MEKLNDIPIGNSDKAILKDGEFVVIYKDGSTLPTNFTHADFKERTKSLEKPHEVFDNIKTIYKKIGTNNFEKLDVEELSKDPTIKAMLLELVKSFVFYEKINDKIDFLLGRTLDKTGKPITPNITDHTQKLLHKISDEIMTDDGRKKFINLKIKDTDEATYNEFIEKKSKDIAHFPNALNPPTDTDSKELFTKYIYNLINKKTKYINEDLITKIGVIVLTNKISNNPMDYDTSNKIDAKIKDVLSKPLPGKENDAPLIALTHAARLEAYRKYDNYTARGLTDVEKQAAYDECIIAVEKYELEASKLFNVYKNNKLFNNNVKYVEAAKSYLEAALITLDASEDYAGIKRDDKIKDTPNKNLDKVRNEVNTEIPLIKHRYEYNMEKIKFDISNKPDEKMKLITNILPDLANKYNNIAKAVVKTAIQDNKTSNDQNSKLNLLSSSTELAYSNYIKADVEFMISFLNFILPAGDPDFENEFKNVDDNILKLIKMGRKLFIILEKFYAYSGKNYNYFINNHLVLSSINLDNLIRIRENFYNDKKPGVPIPQDVKALENEPFFEFDLKYIKAYGRLLAFYEAENIRRDDPAKKTDAEMTAAKTLTEDHNRLSLAAANSINFAANIKDAVHTAERIRINFIDAYFLAIAANVEAERAAQFAIFKANSDDYLREIKEAHNLMNAYKKANPKANPPNTISDETLENAKDRLGEAHDMINKLKKQIENKI